MDPPEKIFQETPTKNRLTAIVFISMRHGVFVKLLTGTRVPKAAPWLDKLTNKKRYKTLAGKDAERMTMEEYIDCCTAMTRHFAGEGATDAKRARMVRQLVLVHDKSTCHPGSPIDVGLRSKLAVSMAAPRSPDLMPLDYAVFGWAKRKLLGAEKKGWTWANRAEFFVKTLQGFDPKPCIKAYEHRLKECYESGGMRVQGKRG